MKKFFIYLFVFSASILAQAENLFDADKLYLITCNDTKKGGLEPASQGIYPLIYNENATENTELALWTIKEEFPDRFSFKNSATGQYLQYVPGNETAKYVGMTDDLNGDYTLFNITNKGTDEEIEYWAVTSVVHNYIFDKKKYDNAVGLYADIHYRNNQLFSFKAQGGSFVKAPQAASGFDDYLTVFTLNEMELAFDKSENLYYYSIPLDSFGGDVSRKLQYTAKEVGYSVNIDGQEVSNGEEYTFENVIANKTFSIQVLNGDEIVCTSKLTFTGLPIVQLYSDSYLSSSFSRGKVRVYEGETDLSGELLNAEIRYRGTSALAYDKKAFAVKLKNENWESINRNFFGLRNDNYWILDAMAVDRSRLRNRVSTDIWNDFSADPYYKSQEPDMINATRGRYVEVFLDDQYWGLYCMTERIDRKQLKLKKYQEDTERIRGVLYKAKQWSKSVLMGNPDYWGAYSWISDYSNESMDWDNFEMKYPDLEDGEKVDWGPLYEVVTFVANSNNVSFREYISQNIDLPVWLDNYLFMELILATDNHGKNAYYYMYNINNEKKLGIAPWDMDGVFGVRWNGMEVNPAQDYSEYISTYEWGENYLYKRLKDLDAAGFNSLLKARYDELRFTHFSAENLIDRFEKYMEMFETVGARAREENRWNGANYISLDIRKEVEYLTNWIIERTSYLDEIYGPAMPPVGIDQPEPATFMAYPNPVIETLYVKDITPETPFWVYSETGICMDKGIVGSSSFTLDFSNYATGRYFLKVGDKGKVIIKK